jgi:hypothetical protein
MSQVEIERLDCAIRERIGRQVLKPKKNNNHWNPVASAHEVRIAEQKRNRELYGDALEDVEFLRRCGWAIHLLPSGRVQFGNQILTLDELREKAGRERRLRQPAPIRADTAAGISKAVR